MGVARSAKIVPIKIAACQETGELLHMCYGLDWIATPWNSVSNPTMQTANPYPVQGSVLNISRFIDAAAPWDTVTPISSFEHAVNNVAGAGVTVVVSANNQANANCTTSPARMAYGNTSAFGSTHRVISVGGTDELDRLWRCANFGDCTNSTPTNPTGTDPGSNTGPCVDIYAPAHNLKLAWNALYHTYRQDIWQKSGTSFAAPLVAGVAARILQNQPGLSPYNVWLAIKADAGALPPNFDSDDVSANDIIVHIPGWK